MFRSDALPTVTKVVIHSITNILNAYLDNFLKYLNLNF